MGIWMGYLRIHRKLTLNLWGLYMYGFPRIIWTLGILSPIMENQMGKIKEYPAALNFGHYGTTWGVRGT